MKRIIITLLLSCVVSAAPAGSHYIYTPNGHAFYFSGRYIYDQQTGREVGYLSNNYLYSPDGQTIGYVSNGYLYSTQNEQTLGYLQGNENCDGE